MNRNAKEVADANAILSRALQHMAVTPTYKGMTSRHIAGTPADNDTFHFECAQFIYRIIRMFGTNGVAKAKLLDPANENAARTLMVTWAQTECKLSDADPNDTWRIWGSENHGAQHDAACWAAADLNADNADTAYADGSRAKSQLQSWTAYLKEYLRQRGAHGTLIEYFSPTYAKYTLLNFYLYYDFSKDPELRALARQTLDLWWAIWAQEQIDGVHGGSKTRTYPVTYGKPSPLELSAWLYFGIGRRPPALAPGEAAMVVSAYRPPDVVADIAIDTKGRGEYDVVTRAPGLNARPTVNLVYHIDPRDESIVRMTHVGDGYVMGMAMLPKLPPERWAAISSQNRWSGIAMAGGDPAKVITIVPQLTDPHNQYNSIWGVQSQSTQILQALSPPYSAGSGTLRVLLGTALHPEEQDGWIYVNDAAYVALRPAWGGYRITTTNGSQVEIIDPTAPLIVQAAPKRAFENFAAFQAAMQATKLSVTGDTLEFIGLFNAGTLHFYGKSDRLPEINGVPIRLNPAENFHSPFMETKPDGSIVIHKDGRSDTINFKNPA